MEVLQLGFELNSRIDGGEIWWRNCSRRRPRRSSETLKLRFDAGNVWVVVQAYAVVATGASSVMVGRGALWNASIFSPEGKLPWEEVKREHVRKSFTWDNCIKSTKHTLREVISHYSSLKLPQGKAAIKSDTLADLAFISLISQGMFASKNLTPSQPEIGLPLLIQMLVVLE
ncbi:hypothetical protein MKW98_017074 [Papaver atlanticum]|uniref:Uncharacterized protein n=1 Tax=Papaver atlanticum TaxID=357466 RepID=A0AAD4XXW8_9MAGN|nr:hypothetical protein MKW98_017074 [Papaver atlanticum]